MPNAVAHILITIILIDIFRDYFLPEHHLKKFPRWMVLIGGVAGLLPDIDMPFSWLYDAISGSQLTFHGGITHIYLIPVVILAIAWIMYFLKKEKATMLLCLIFFGYALHITLDFLILGGVYQPFMPFSNFSLPHTLFTQEQMVGFDAILLIAWLFYEEFKHKIKDYI
jgi:membrane-bound metal-dependent hydrolase YbcI (DUF457 family)